MESTVSLVLPAGALLAAFGAIYAAGVLTGRFNKHEELIEKRVARLEDINSNKITREEMDARFEAITSEIGGLRTMMERILTHIEHRGDQ